MRRAILLALPILSALTITLTLLPNGTPQASAEPQIAATASDRVEAHSIIVLRHKNSLAHVAQRVAREKAARAKRLEAREKAARPAASYYPWSVVCMHESHCTWNINTGNGYYGGLQFSLQSWRGVGCLEFAPRPDLATMLQQEKCADRLLRVQGPGAWPNTYPR